MRKSVYNRRMLKMTKKQLKRTRKAEIMVIDTPTLALTPNVVTEELRRRIGNGTQEALASELEISPSLITEILKGRRTASPSLLEKLGITEITVHVPNAHALHVVGAIQTVMGEVKLLDTVVEHARKKAVAKS